MQFSEKVTSTDRKKNKTLTMMQLDVSCEDIEEMNDQMNSVKCDIGIANAISIALRKRLKTKYIPRVEFALSHNACQLRVGKLTFPLPQNLYWWLRESLNKIEVSPKQFSFAIPEGWLLKNARRAGNAGERVSESLAIQA